jgi:leucyl aminopeptidase
MIDLPDFSPLKIVQSQDKAGRKEIDALDHLIAVLPAKPREADFRGLPKAAYLQRLFERNKKSGEKIVTTYLDNKRGTAVTLATLGLKRRFETLTFARKLIAESTRVKPAKLGIVTSGFETADRDAVLTALVAAAGAAAFKLPSYKSKGSSKTASLKSVKLFAASPRVSLEAEQSKILGNNIARWLTALPPNKLTASSYRAAAETLAKIHGMTYEFLDVAKLRELEAGAFLAVAQGNAHEDAGIIRLTYRPGRARKPALALVGKGILFDTGGNNLKPFKGMLEMHTDMQGSAVALGVAVALAERGVDFGFDVWLAVTENRISATAYKSQDVIVAANGTSIQVIHTDAEGRMVLADTLTLAAEKHPDLIIDYATLTGACVAALTTRYSGVFSNRERARDALVRAGETSGERVWPFPFDADYEDSLQSAIADVKQCAAEGSGDHILAARFLSRFVPDDVAWVHLDLSAGQHKGGLAQIPSDITGFGVAYTLDVLADGGPAALAAAWSSEAE